MVRVGTQSACPVHRTYVLISLAASPTTAGDIQEENATAMTVNTLTADAPHAHSDIRDARVPDRKTPSPDSRRVLAPEASAEKKPTKAPAKKTAGKKTKTLEL